MTTKAVPRWKFNVEYPDGYVTCDDYESAAKLLGIRKDSLQVYLARGGGITTRKVWRDDLEQEVEVTVRRVRIDPAKYRG